MRYVFGLKSAFPAKLFTNFGSGAIIAPRVLSTHGRRLAPPFCKPGLRRSFIMEEGDFMVTYADLFAFVVMLTGVIALTYEITKK